MIFGVFLICHITNAKSGNNYKKKKGSLTIMIEQDTIKLLRECDAGVKMGVSSIT